MDDSKPDLIRNIGSQWVSVVYGAAVTFLLLLFLARRLGPSAFALYLYIQAVASLFAILQDGGFQVLLFRENVTPSPGIGLSAEDLASRYFGYVTFVTLLGMAAVLVSPAALKGGLLLAFLYTALRCVTSLVSSVLKGHGAFQAEAFWRIRLNTLLALPVLLLVGLTEPTPEKVFLGFVAGQIVILSLKQSRRILSRPRFALPPWHLWKTCLAFVVISGATTVYFRSDIVLLRHLQPDLALVGQYGAAFQILEGVILFATPVVHLCFRQLRLNWLDREAFLGRMGKILAGSAGAAFCITAAGLLFGPEVILLAYGEAYGPAGEILPLLLFALLFILPNFVLTQSLIALNEERYYAAAAVLCAVFNVGLNLLLIPRYLAWGAAASTVATEALLTLLLGLRIFSLRRRRVPEGLPGESEN